MYKCYWIISNFVRHIKKQHTIVVELDESLNEIVVEEPETDSVVRLQPQQHQRLMNYSNDSGDESRDK